MSSSSGPSGKPRGALLETDGRNFMALLDMCHFIVNHITGEYDFKNDLEEASLLRKKDSAGSAKLTAQMYTYWDSAPDGSPGVYSLLKRWVRENQEAAKRKQGNAQGNLLAHALPHLVANEVEHWPRQRVTGTFYFAKETAAGAALLVDEQIRHVYRVLGISKSIASMLRESPRKDSLCGSPLHLTLLPFMNSVVYDATFCLDNRPLANQLPNGLEQHELLAIAEEAEKAAKVITVLEAAVCAPLAGKYVRIDGLVGRKELNGTYGSALDWHEERGRYAVRLPSGEQIALKPTNLELAKDQSTGGQGRRGGLSLGLSAREKVLQGQIQSQIRKARKAGGEESTWVFRRVGYTEASNPSHQIVVLGSDGMFLDTFASEALQPKAEEILETLGRIVGKSGTKPNSIAVDEQSIIERLQHVLDPADLFCGYYPPPSKEELVSMGQFHDGHA